MSLKSLLVSSAICLAALLPTGSFAKDLTVAIPNNLTGMDPANVNDTLSQTSLRLMYQGALWLRQGYEAGPASGRKL